MQELSATSLHESILTHLRDCGFLADFSLAVYCRTKAVESPENDALQPCCTSACSTLCGTVCIKNLPSIFDSVPENGQPTFFRCPVGLLGFAMQLESGSGFRHYLVGTGVRDRYLDLYRIEAVSKTEGFNPFALLEQLQQLPVSSEHKVMELAERVYAMTRTMLEPAEPALPQSAAQERLKIVAAISVDIDRCESPREVFTLLQETLGILYDVPAIAAVMPDFDDSFFTLEGGWGYSVDAERIEADVLEKYFPPETTATVLREENLNEIFPRIQACVVTCQPLAGDGELHGVILLLDREFDREEYYLIELLSGRASLRLSRLRREEEFSRKNLTSGRLLSMISTLALSEGQEMHDLVLKMASELVNASSGSLMLLDHEQELLHIKSALGMNPHLLKVMSIKVGTGIAGKVAASGNPLLVNDIEKDERIASPNRPRFKTKSFVSMPLIFRGRTWGVLNLSDKKNNGIFTDADLDLLSPFVNHISAIVQRSRDEQKVEMLERLSITDPLTELYNRRFLERRMEEETNRSRRSGVNLTVMLIDLDYFKTYNDICGHIAGDKALKKAAKVLRASVREMDVVTRYGGEEFCVLLPGTSKRESVFVAERIRHDIENEMFQGEEHLPLGRLTTSIGISSFPEDGATSTAVIHAADIALYEAKSNGRNRIVIFNNSSHSDSVESFPKITLMKK